MFNSVEANWEIEVKCIINMSERIPQTSMEVPPKGLKGYHYFLTIFKIFWRTLTEFFPREKLYVHD